MFQQHRISVELKHSVPHNFKFGGSKEGAFPWQRSTQHPRTAEVTIGMILERLPKIASIVTALFMFLMTLKRRAITAARSRRGVIGKGSRLPHVLQHYTTEACCLYHLQVSIFHCVERPRAIRPSSGVELRPLNLVCQRLPASRSRIGQKRQFARELIAELHCGALATTNFWRFALWMEAIAWN